MSPTTILEPTTGRPWRPRELLQNNAVVIIGIGVIALLAMLFVRAAPVHDRTVTVTNPTVYELGVEVSGPDSGWVPIGTVDREATLTVNHVYDEGATWRIRFSGQGVDGGSMQMSRTDLESNGWQVTVPDAVNNQLTNGGATASPKH